MSYEQKTPNVLILYQVMNTYASFLLHVNAVGEDEDIVLARAAEIEAVEVEKTVEPLVVRRAGSRILRRFFIGKMGHLRQNIEAEMR